MMIKSFAKKFFQSLITFIITLKLDGFKSEKKNLTRDAYSPVSGGESISPQALVIHVQTFTDQ